MCEFENAPEIQKCPKTFVHNCSFLMSFDLYTNLLKFDTFVIKSALTTLVFIFQSWPDDALQVVAQRFLEELEMEPQVKKGCVQMCKTFHTGTRNLSKSFLDELKRHNYVTPTSYLELISTFKNLLNMKQV